VTNDTHGSGGVPHNISTLDECKEACMKDTACVAVDWESNNVGKYCWILTRTATASTTKAGVVSHHELQLPFLVG